MVKISFRDTYSVILLGATATMSTWPACRGTIVIVMLVFGAILTGAMGSRRFSAFPFVKLKLISIVSAPESSSGLKIFF